MDSNQIIKDIFLKYLNREPLAHEYSWHTNKTYQSLTDEILKCSEYNELVQSKKIQNRVAILISGHMRSNEIERTLHLLNGYNYDVFIHTWDNMGFKGKETNLKDSVDRNLIESMIKRMPNVKSYKIENNETYITSLVDDDDITYFNFSSPEKFIKSQLYSINQSFNIFDEYRIQNNVQYDLVIRTRFDNAFTFFSMNELLISEIKNNKVIFTPNNGCNHEHMDSDSTTCLVCETMFKKYNLKNVHTFDHSHVICDIFAYGDVESMRHYCSLYDVYDSLNKTFENKNKKTLDDLKIEHTVNGNVFLLERGETGHLDSLYYLNCSYPERLLQIHLKDYILPSSTLIKVEFKR
jgi:hypothetical protein